MPETFETLADLLRPQGRQGEILCEPHSSDLTRLAPGKTAFIIASSANAPAAGIERTPIEALWQPTGRNAGRIVLKLAGCSSISEAEALCGSKLVAPISERPALDESDTYYVSDLIGCALLDGEHHVGEVVDIEFATTPDGRTRLEDAAPLLVVHTARHDDAHDETDVLVPFIRAQIVSVDLTAKRILMTLPEGLFDLAL